MVFIIILIITGTVVQVIANREKVIVFKSYLTSGPHFNLAYLIVFLWFILILIVIIGTTLYSTVEIRLHCVIVPIIIVTTIINHKYIIS